MPTSACEFDTSPATLKELKAAKVPDAVILVMIETGGVQRVYATTQLRQNYDTAVRACRSRYEARTKAIDAE